MNIIIKGSKIDIRISILIIPIIAIMAAAGCIKEFILLFLSVFIHEAAHIGIALITGRKIYCITILPVGLNASIEYNGKDRFENAAIFLSGPFTNLLLALIFYGLHGYLTLETLNISLFIRSNIYLALFNLLPVLPLDGGQILMEISRGQYGLFASYRYLRKVSLWAATGLILLGIVQIIYSLGNFSLLMVGVYIFFCVKSEGVEIALMNIKNLLFRRSRILKKGIYPARDLIVLKSKCIGEVVKNMDFDRFHIIYVLDDDLRIIKIFTEQEVINAMIKHNSNMTFETLAKLDI